MKIGVLGGGRMGTALGGALERIGHQVMTGSRRTGKSHREAAIFGDVLVLATRWEDTQRILEECGPFDSKVLISCVNPETDDEPLVVGHTTSAAEEIARWAPGAKVVEAFNGLYAEWLDLAPAASSQTVLYCGDDAAARETVRSLIVALGFDALDAGPLRNARYLEPMTSLLVYLVRVAGYGPTGIHAEWKRLPGKE